METVDWEYPNLVSMIVMRDPLERFLAGGKCGRFDKPPYNLTDGPTPDDKDIWWMYASESPDLWTGLVFFSV